MARLQKKLKISEGFSLLEVAVALLILSISVIAVYQFITSTSLSSLQLTERVIAREVANNRVALMNTIDPPLMEGPRRGIISMNGKNWLWEEKTQSISKEFFQYSIEVKNAKSQQVIFIREGFIEKR